MILAAADADAAAAETFTAYGVFQDVHFFIVINFEKKTLGV